MLTAIPDDHSDPFALDYKVLETAPPACGARLDYSTIRRVRLSER